MKFNWGVGITLFYGSFMAILLYFVFKSGSYDHSLVTDDYYAQDLKYQQHYDKVVNSMALSEEVDIRYDNSEGNISILFPKEVQGVKGQILFFRPSTSKLDLSYPIQLDELNEMQIPTQKIKKGRWIIKADWNAEGKNYYKESEIVFE